MARILTAPGQEGAMPQAQSRPPGQKGTREIDGSWDLSCSQNRGVNVFSADAEVNEMFDLFQIPACD
jgi:hypothetical protein